MNFNNTTFYTSALKKIIAMGIPILSYPILSYPILSYPIQHSDLFLAIWNSCLQSFTMGSKCLLRHCEALAEAIQGGDNQSVLDCFVAVLLAMTQWRLPLTAYRLPFTIYFNRSQLTVHNTQHPAHNSP